MNNNRKLLAYDNITAKLKKIAVKAINNNCFEKAMAAISSCANIMYQINQVYMDEDLENMAIEIAEKLYVNEEKYEADYKTVMFYDGFGLDLRGLAITQTKAIAACGYNLIYVTTKRAIGRIPHIINELKPYKVDVVYIDMDNYLAWTKELNDVFLKFKPKVAFFYTNPDDVAGAVVFNAYKGKVVRYQIDLTDHAFWIGAKSVDYNKISRDIGYSNSIYHRGFKPEQIKVLNGLTYINKDKIDEPDPFDISKEKYIFSGGALYKTLGDEGLLFYKAVEHILSTFSDIKFLYAGSGDSRQIVLLQNMFPGRVFLIAERPDFYRYIENCLLYLNTYPMFGGMMMRYAAIAHKIPVTLRHKNDADGILFYQKELGIEFDTYDDFIKEIDKLINDKEYRRLKECNMEKGVMTEEVYKRNIQSMIEENTTEFSLNLPNEIDTTLFRREYLERFDFESGSIKAIAKMKNKTLLFDFPSFFIKKALKKYIKI